MAKKILIIEDEPDVARSMQILLESEGYKADFALSGKEGLKKMKEYDLILLDIMMPKMSGRQVLQEMKKLKIGKPVIVVSAVGIPEAVQVEMNSIYPGAGFVSKPYVGERLVPMIQKKIGK